jgi:hypothetical protein
MSLPLPLEAIVGLNNLQGKDLRQGVANQLKKEEK